MGIILINKVGMKSAVIVLALLAAVIYAGPTSNQPQAAAVKVDPDV